MKRILYFGILFTLFLVFSCEDETDKGGTEFTLGTEVIKPTEVKAESHEGGLKISLKQERAIIEIITPDTLAGTYDISPNSKKASALPASLSLLTDGTEYYGINGYVEISYGNGKLAGSFESDVKSGSGKILEIREGSFAAVAVSAPELPVLTEQQIIDTLIFSYTLLNNFVQYASLFDAVYTNLLSIPDNSWTDIYNHNQNATDPKIWRLWSEGYGVIKNLNLVISGISQLEENTSLISAGAEAKAMRAYVYTCLMSWFGDIPVLDEDSGEESARIPVAQVGDYILSDAYYSTENLPAAWDTENDFRTTKYFPLSVNINYCLSSERYTESLEKAENIINSGNFALEPDPGSMQWNGYESVFAFSSGLLPEYSAVISKFAFNPVFRYTGTLLAAAEAAFALGNSLEATQYLNNLRARSSQEPYTMVTVDQIYDQFIFELKLEGGIFSIMKSLGKAEELLQIPDFKLLLPVPMPALDMNPDLTQNPGY